MTVFKHELIGCVGQPIAENPTGVMQEAAFQRVGLAWRYLLFEAGPSELGDVVKGMRAMKFRGANFTTPHKVAIWEHLDRVAESGQLIGAVNTARIDDGAWVGENTDGKGFMQSLAEAGVGPAGKRVAILGAGGAARAISVELALAGAREIRVVNRSADRADPLVRLINEQTATTARHVPWEGRFALDGTTDMLINATSVGLYPSSEKPDIDYDTIGKEMLVCDVIPNPPDTPFLEAARGRGAKTLDGLGMLVFQGAIAFEMWTGRKAPCDVMRKALAEAFSPARQ